MAMVRMFAGKFAWEGSIYAVATATRRPPRPVGRPHCYDSRPPKLTTDDF